MPIYEFRCRQCDARFEERRAMADADVPARCPSGHVDAARLLPVFAATGFASSDTQGCGAGASCCGGACAHA